MATVEIVHRCWTEDFPALPKEAQHGILEKLKILTRSPEFGKPLTRQLKGLRRMTWGRYRIVYRYHKQSESVFVLAVGLRKVHDWDDVYAWLNQHIQEGQTAETAAVANQLGRHLVEEIQKQSKAQSEVKRGGG